MPLLGSNTLCVSVYQSVLLLHRLNATVIFFFVHSKRNDCLLGTAAGLKTISPGFLTRPLPKAYAYVGVRQHHVPSSNAVIT